MFEPFLRLPKELRLLIWQLVAEFTPTRQVVYFRSRYNIAATEVRTGEPVVFSVCQEQREELERIKGKAKSKASSWKVLQNTCFQNDGTSLKIEDCFDPSRDIACYNFLNCMRTNLTFSPSLMKEGRFQQLRISSLRFLALDKVFIGQPSTGILTKLWGGRASYITWDTDGSSHWRALGTLENLLRRVPSMPSLETLTLVRILSGEKSRDKRYSGIPLKHRPYARIPKNELLSVASDIEALFEDMLPSFPSWNVPEVRINQLHGLEGEDLFES
ncbi:unnamed protein product [Diplocarpon coronariae]|uniref:2EXR domain-containing protein n=1 Tax=Diplocarpon coronariae TaxID=2795749 RepID=A0A218ZFC7_9HELO|nr:hypothetical protein JHW43_008090 [Diplocarpon mali]OWP06300.1 hypothetical protein B2J93_4916 [Marssonina coronariae]